MAAEASVDESTPHTATQAGDHGGSGSFGHLGASTSSAYEVVEAGSHDGGKDAFAHQAATPEDSPEQQLLLLQERHRQYQQWLAQYISSARANFGATGEATSCSDDLGQANGAADTTSSATLTAKGDAAAKEAVAARVSGLLESLHAMEHSKHYIACLKAAAESTREMERSMRPLQDTNDDVAAFASAWYASVQTLAFALYHQEMAAHCQPTALKTFPQLEAVSTAVSSRLDVGRSEMQGLVEQRISDALQHFGWPPGFEREVAAARSNAGASTGGTGDATSSTSGRSNGGASGTRKFVGFERDPEQLSKLATMLTCLTVLQQALQRTAFEDVQRAAAIASGTVVLGPGDTPPDAATPELWAVRRLAKPLADVLADRFSPQAEMGAPDRPEWMLKTVASLAGELGPLVEPLSGFLPACGLQGSYHLAVEFARALREVAKRLLREVRLPYLQQLASTPPGAPGRNAFSYKAASAAAAAAAAAAQAAEQLPAGVSSVGELWLMQVDAIIEFERLMLPHLGAILDTDAAVPEALASGSCMAVLGEHDEWFEAWSNAECASVRKQLEAVVLADDAWGVPSAVALDVALDGAASAEPAFRREFFPPRLAEKALGLLEHVIDRSRHIPDVVRQRQFLEAAGEEVLGGVERRLSSVLDQAAAFSEILGPFWRPQVASCICAARFLSHQLTELLSSSPHLRRSLVTGAHVPPDSSEQGEGSMWTPMKAAASASGRSASATAGAAGVAGPSASATTTPGSGLRVSTPPLGGHKLGASFSTGSAQGDSPWAALSDVQVQHSYAPPAPPTPPVWAQQLRVLGSLHRDWCLRLAKELAVGFGQAAVQYRRLMGPRSAYPTPHSDADAGGVSPALLPALTFLRDQLDALSLVLDAPSFRDIWRAVVVSLNRFMYNYVATEARFTAAGAAQFLVDANGLVSLLSPYTARPAAHFRELLAAARLLSLSDEQAADVVRHVSAPSYRANSSSSSSNPTLASFGVLGLTAHQVMCVLEHRL